MTLDQRTRLELGRPSQVRLAFGVSVQEPATSHTRTSLCHIPFFLHVESPARRYAATCRLKSASPSVLDLWWILEFPGVVIATVERLGAGVEDDACPRVRYALEDGHRRRRAGNSEAWREDDSVAAINIYVRNTCGWCGRRVGGESASSARSREGRQGRS